MSKVKVAIAAPFDTKSGYGERSRDVIHALLKLKKDEWDFQFISLRWGNCSFGLLGEEDNDLFIKTNTVANLTQQPDIFIQIGIPNEFQRIGKYFNILFTAGTESTPCSPAFIEGVNRTDLTIVSSMFTKQVFLDSQYGQMDRHSGLQVGTLKVEKPIETLFEGVNTDLFNTTTVDNVDYLLKDVKEKFCFLTVGTWLSGPFNEDRKNISGLIKVFLETFKNKQNAPALILKTQGANASIVDREDILAKIREIRKSIKGKNTLPNIYLIHGELTPEELNGLYNHPKVKAMTLLTKGEGWGRPLLEFSLTKKPIITTEHSGQMDFLHKDFVAFVKGGLTQIHPACVVENILIPESKWYTFNPIDANKQLLDVFENYKAWSEKGKRQAYHTKINFNLDAMSVRLDEILKQYIPFIPTEQKLILPKLPKLPKLTPNVPSTTVS